MDEKKEEVKADGGKCGSGGCGIHCGCCVCKAIKAFLLVLIGGVIGFFIGHCCGYHHRMCRMEAPAAQSAAAPAPAATEAPKKGK